ncbi:IclR family transcriptional regulator [Enterovibrio norvegicus]|uniref:HTH-type transcriptional repressor AllR n=1 Tax=Enterovibrio norvegicus DSM 15893 TaxID=1121869 RepID=A0A1I5K8I9_9GAMM|nr:IclR family transcriptional regulator [Enterovibrio norvegicus]OEE63705.1 IclR family transcriptional regulator [Enterovibrio norvegicus]OEF51733.1 IclR family transcriptional regulator [Enterovibrio norvegicus]SFO81043.1 transcriptional regulator, IclR family [Enterovibrio norvegicus DSM 15893]
MTDQKREKGSSILRVLEIVEAVSRAERPPSPAELAIELDIPKPSIHRLLQQLERDGFLQTDMRGQLVPGSRLHDVAMGVLHSTRFKANRQAILQHLSDLVGETCGISIPNGKDMIYYDRVQANWPLQISLLVGSNTPVWCTASGKLYLSSLPARRRQRLINDLQLTSLTRNTIIDPAKLEKNLKQTERSGLGVDNEEFVDGMVAVAVPINNCDGGLVACLFTHAPVIRKSLDDLLQCEPQLREAAAKLEDLMNQGM